MDDPERVAAHAAWRSAEQLKRISDRLIGVGPFGLGLDGALALVPVAGTIYSAGAGIFVLWQGLKARATPFTLMRMLGYVAIDTILSDVPIIGQIGDLFFPGHMLAAGALQKDIVKRHGPPLDSLKNVTPRPATRPAPG